MTDLERALRDTLADPPVDVPSDKYAIHDIERRIERRRSRQKHLAAGLGVAAVVAAAIAVPVATGVDLGSNSSHTASSGGRGARGDDRVAQGQAVPRPQNVPGPVWTAAQALIRDYGRPSRPVQWVQTTPEKWAQLRHISSLSSSTGQFYVLQFRGFSCPGRCPALPPGVGAKTLTAVVDARGRRIDIVFDASYKLATLGTVHTFTVR